MEKQSTLIRALTAGAFITALAGVNVHAQSQDALLDKLVSKGVLTQDEAKELRDEADEGFKRSYQAKSGMPDWVDSLKLNGDFRGRYESFFNDQASVRNRYRYRLRFGVVATLHDNFEVGFRLGSGDATASGGLIDPISNNQTLDNNGAKKGIYIDLAYAKWTPIQNSSWNWGTTVGKMENPFVTSDLVFDKDYTPEGLAMQLKYNFNSHHAFKLNGGAFVVDEVGSSSRDPFLFGAQARFDSIWDEKSKWSSTAGVGIFAITHDERLVTGAVPNINAGNTRVASGADFRPAEGFNPIVVDGAVTYTLDSFPMYTGKFPISVGGDYMHNPAAQNYRDGYSVGVTFGKSGKKKTWDLSYRFRELQPNAWFEELVDSDSGAFYGSGATGGLANSGKTGTPAGYVAGTNVRGHIIKASYSPWDSFTLGITYFDMDAIVEHPLASGSHIGRLQVDALWKF